MYADMEWWESVRRRVLVEGVSKRQVMRETGIHWETLRKILAFSSPPGYRLAKPRGEPKIVTIAVAARTSTKCHRSGENGPPTRDDFLAFLAQAWFRGQAARTCP